MSRRLRVIDFVANPGGGVRFTVEMVRAFLRSFDVSIELVSHGEALARYATLLHGDRIRMVDVPPAAAWRARTLMAGIPGAGPLNRLLGTGRYDYEIPAQLLEGIEVVWLPWIHRHRVPWSHAQKVVASLHDLIALEFPGILSDRHRRDERETTGTWLSSSARIVVSSNTTAGTAQRLFGTAPARLTVIPISGDHQQRHLDTAPSEWPFTGHEYLLSPINISPHKNADVLLKGAAVSSQRHPLVLTGSGMDLWPPRSPRAVRLVRLAEAAGLQHETSLFALGYVHDRAYEHLLCRAWALVMPTLAEGGGSFPVLEAMAAGIPVISSDIPVMREMVERTGGNVLWFDPRDPDDLASKLAVLEAHYAEYRAIAERQATTLRLRSWDDVARDYGRILGLDVNSRRSGDA